MITNLIINIFVLIVGALFSLFPVVTVLPTIVGFNLDAALVTGAGQLNTFLIAFWPIKTMFQGFLFLMGYYAVKIGIRFLIGHRTPGSN